MATSAIASGKLNNHHFFHGSVIDQSSTNGPSTHIYTRAMLVYHISVPGTWTVMAKGPRFMGVLGMGKPSPSKMKVMLQALP